MPNSLMIAFVFPIIACVIVFLDPYLEGRNQRRRRRGSSSVRQSEGGH